MKKQTNKRPIRISSHYLGTIISKNQRKLTDVKTFTTFLKDLLDEVEATNLGISYHVFQNNSFTLVALLAESHITLHTWPERFAVQLDVFLCNYMHDNSEKGESIYKNIVEYFEPSEHDMSVIERL